MGSIARRSRTSLRSSVNDVTMFFIGCSPLLDASRLS